MLKTFTPIKHLWNPADNYGLTRSQVPAMKSRRYFTDYYDEAGPFVVDRFIELTGTHRRTVDSWLKKDACPMWAYMIFEQLRGKIEFYHKHWDGWTINHRGELCSPGNDIFSMGRVLGVIYKDQLIRELRKKLRLIEKAATEAKSAAEAEALPSNIIPFRRRP